jgi:hypothetical protein
VSKGLVPFKYISLLDQLHFCAEILEFRERLILEPLNDPDHMSHFCNHKYFQWFTGEAEKYKQADVYKSQMQKATAGGKQLIFLPIALQFFFDDFSITLKKKAGGLYVAIANLPSDLKSQEFYR